MISSLAQKLIETCTNCPTTYLLQSYHISVTGYLSCFDKLSDSTLELAITVANRSATFYRLHQYELALQDIDLVLSLDYPPELCYKVLDR
jgi:hypothetical protein